MVLYSLLFSLINITNVHLIMMLSITKNYQSVVSFPQTFGLHNVLYIHKKACQCSIDRLSYECYNVYAVKFLLVVLFRGNFCWPGF